MRLKSGMRDLIPLFVHLLTTTLRVVQPGGVRAVIAESVLIQHQLLILNRSRRRAPNLRTLDRLVAGFCSFWIRPTRLGRVAIAFKPSTFRNFHRAMVQRKYRLLFSPKQRRKPGDRSFSFQSRMTATPVNSIATLVTPQCRVAGKSISAADARTLATLSLAFDASGIP